MDVQMAQKQLTLQAEMIRALATGISPDEARWRPDEKAWSMVEVVNHLYDEEREDFRAHLRQVLAQDGSDWLRIDPQGWVVERAYQQRDLQTSLENFLEERRQSLAWLSALPAVDWDAAYPAPWGGAMRAGDVLAAWLAHDWLHIRQLVELRRELAVKWGAPYSVEYAGDW